MNNQINIPTRKLTSCRLIAAMVNKKFKSIVKQFMQQYKAYNFMNSVS